MAGATDTNAVDALPVACPQCSAQVPFHRSAAPHIDACGFESYNFDCQICRASLAGIVDPADDTLLVSQIIA